MAIYRHTLTAHATRRRSRFYWSSATLRNRLFFSLSAVNAAIRDLFPSLNGKVARHLGAGRQALFEQLEKLAQKPPGSPYGHADWREARAGLG
ncbi:MAG: hypothetical protein AAGH38_00420 [Pseudomonadota bacterium]